MTQSNPDQPTADRSAETAGVIATVAVAAFAVATLARLWPIDEWSRMASTLRFFSVFALWFLVVIGGFAGWEAILSRSPGGKWQQRHLGRRFPKDPLRTFLGTYLGTVAALVALSVGHWFIAGMSIGAIFLLILAALFVSLFIRLFICLFV